MLKRLIVKNYRSLRELDISLRPLMVLVGPNASGKSNFLDVFKFLRDFAVERNINEAIGRRGGYRSLVWNGDAASKITVQVRVEFGAMQPAEASDYQVQIEHEGNLRVSEAGLTVAVYSFLRDWGFYRFTPQNMRPPQPVSKQTRLKEDGSNLSSVIHWLFSDGDPSYREIEGLFKVFVPEADTLVSPLSDDGSSTTYAAFRQKNLNLLIRTNSMSDGTLFGLALIVALFAPDRPQLIGIEAPDMEMHPYLMEHVAELLRVASEKAQIIITTHSPFLLDCLPPESIAIVEKENGETKIRWAEDKEGVREAIKLLGAGEAWRAGHLGGVPS